MSRPAAGDSGRLGFALLTVAVLLPSVATAQDDQETYLAFGDSITAGVGETDANETGYPSRLESLLREAGRPGARVENHGVAGETTLEGLGRINSVLSRGGDFILIMEGTNDINQDISTGSILFNLERMVDRAESAGVTPIWATIIPLQPSALTDQDEELAIDMRQRSLSESLDLVDCFAAYDYFPDAWPDLYNQNLRNDPVGHPNGAGYDLIAQTFADVLLDNDTQPPVLGEVEPAPGSEEVSPSQQVSVVVFDHGEGIDTTATRMIVDGDQVQAQRAGSASRSTFTYTPPEAWSGGVRVEMDLVDRASPLNRTRVTATTFVIEGTNFFRGDVNRDGRVDGFDLVLLAFSFGSSEGDRRYRPEHDLDNDDFVGGSDLAILASNFGKESS